MKLGVNIDHIATLREARKEAFPDPTELAKQAVAGGADGIVCHLREDRRHINDEDLKKLRKLPTRLDMEMAATDEMVRIAIKTKPEMVTIVPEKRKEVTTEGGLDLNPNSRIPNPELGKIINKLKKAGIIVSLFIDPDLKQVETAAVLMADFIEIHTGKYSLKKSSAELEKIGIAVQKARMIGLRINAGHGLDYENVLPVARIPGVEELNIGFSIIARATEVGLKIAVEEMKKIL